MTIPEDQVEQGHYFSHAPMFRFMTNVAQGQQVAMFVGITQDGEKSDRQDVMHISRRFFMTRFAFPIRAAHDCATRTMPARAIGGRWPAARPSRMIFSAGKLRQPFLLARHRTERPLGFCFAYSSGGRSSTPGTRPGRATKSAWARPPGSALIRTKPLVSVASEWTAASLAGLRCPQSAASAISAGPRAIHGFRTTGKWLKCLFAGGALAGRFYPELHAGIIPLLSVSVKSPFDLRMSQCLLARRRLMNPNAVRAAPVPADAEPGLFAAGAK